MDSKGLKELLKGVKSGQVEINDALDILARLPYEAIDDILFDHHRMVRKGLPEIVYGPGKSVSQLVSLSRRLVSRQSPFLITRLDSDVAEALCKEVPELNYDPVSRCCWLAGTLGEEEGKKRPDSLSKGTLIITAGAADLPVAMEARLCLQLMGIYNEILSDVGVAGIHRLFDNLSKILEPRVIIVMAGMEGALPSVVAGIAKAPVIAVPTSTGYGSNFNGVVPLLAMLNSCAPGIGVVNIDNGIGAALFAASIIQSCNT